MICGAKISKTGVREARVKKEDYWFFMFDSRIPNLQLNSARFLWKSQNINIS
jgi:hypothetical protein